jgi:hypothetical protein
MSFTLTLEEVEELSRYLDSRECFQTFCSTLKVYFSEIISTTSERPGRSLTIYFHVVKVTLCAKKLPICGLKLVLDTIDAKPKVMMILVQQCGTSFSEINMAHISDKCDKPFFCSICLKDTRQIIDTIQKIVEGNYSV